MALPSTILRFNLEVADVDRSTYETLELRVARHPSEGDHFLVTRVIAAALHIGDGAELSRAGLCDPDDPPVLAKDLTGRITHWIDIGSPSPDRLHKAAKKADNVFVYTYRRPEPLVESIRKAGIYRAQDLQLFSLDQGFLDTLAGSLGRTNTWALVRTEGELFVTAGETSASCPLCLHPIEG